MCDRTFRVERVKGGATKFLKRVADEISEFRFNQRVVGFCPQLVILFTRPVHEAKPEAEEWITNAISTAFAPLFLFCDWDVLVYEPKSRQPVQIF